MYVGGSLSLAHSLFRTLHACGGWKNVNINEKFSHPLVHANLFVFSATTKNERTSKEFAFLFIDFMLWFFVNSFSVRRFSFHICDTNVSHRMDDNDTKHKQTKSQRCISSHGQMVMHARNTIDKLQINYVNYVCSCTFSFDQYVDF